MLAVFFGVYISSSFLVHDAPQNRAPPSPFSCLKLDFGSQLTKEANGYRRSYQQR